jgi:hypothetical protein
MIQVGDMVKLDEFFRSSIRLWKTMTRPEKGPVVQPDDLLIVLEIDKFGVGNCAKVLGPTGVGWLDSNAFRPF